MNLEYSRAQGRKKLKTRKVRSVVERLDGTPFMLEVFINKNFYANAFMDSRCLCYSAFNRSFVKHHKLPRYPIETRELKLAKKDPHRRKINEITCVKIDLDGRVEIIWGYDIKDLA